MILFVPWSASPCQEGQAKFGQTNKNGIYVGLGNQILSLSGMRRYHVYYLLFMESFYLCLFKIVQSPLE